MPKLKRLSGSEVISILSGFGFQIHSQRGSHAKLKRIEQGQTQILTVPLHKELDRGTLQAIFRQACRFISDSELRSKFYTD